MSGRYCVVIPAYQAAKNIGELVRRIKEQGLAVVVVDDGSRDATAALAAGAGALVISHLRNEGKGRALRTGFDHVVRERYDGVITMDGDGQHDPAEIPELIRAGELQHAGIVLGNRMTNPAVAPPPGFASQSETSGVGGTGAPPPMGGRDVAPLGAGPAPSGGGTGAPMPRALPVGLHAGSMPPARRRTNALMSSIVSALAGQPIPDSQCGFRLIRKEVLEDLPLRARRYEIETELLLKAARRRWKIISVPIRSIYDNHASHIQPLREGLRFIGIILRALFRR